MAAPRPTHRLPVPERHSDATLTCVPRSLASALAGQTLSSVAVNDGASSDVVAAVNTSEPRRWLLVAREITSQSPTGTSLAGVFCR